jgi:hypothetical protein
MIVCWATLKIPCFYKTWGSSPCSQELATSPYPEPDECSPHPTNLFLYDPVSSDVHLHLSRGLFPSGFPMRIVSVLRGFQESLSLTHTHHDFQLSLANPYDIWYTWASGPTSPPGATSKLQQDPDFSIYFAGFNLMADDIQVFQPVILWYHSTWRLAVRHRTRSQWSTHSGTRLWPWN